MDEKVIVIKEIVLTFEVAFIATKFKCSNLTVRSRTLRFSFFGASSINHEIMSTFIYSVSYAIH